MHRNSSPSVTMALQPELYPRPQSSRGSQGTSSNVRDFRSYLTKHGYSQHERPTSAQVKRPQTSLSCRSGVVQKYKAIVQPASNECNKSSSQKPLKIDFTINTNRHCESKQPQKCRSPQPPKQRCSSVEPITGTVCVYPPSSKPPTPAVERVVSTPTPVFYRTSTLFPTPPCLLSPHRRSCCKRCSCCHCKTRKSIIYKITVRTGNEKGCGTDAKVYITLIGQRGKTPKWGLFKKRRPQPFRFAKGSTEIFSRKGKDIGAIMKIIIEHDGISEKDSWYLQDIEVDDLKYYRSYRFNCNKWLSLFKGDCRISVIIFAQPSNHAAYEITVETGKKRLAGTSANVFVTLRGSKGTTNKIGLHPINPNAFARGQIDVFKISAKNVGLLKTLRVEHDNQGSDPAWFLERIVVVNLNKSMEKIYFPCGQWLSIDEQLFRELEAHQEENQKNKMEFYSINVFTGDESGAGTDANVYITLFGEKGDSSRMLLDNSENNFKKGSKDIFTSSCRYVGKLDKIRIGHDNSGSSPGWFLDKVVIYDTILNLVCVFPCQQWLARDKGDGRIVRELVCGKEGPKFQYTVTVYTGNVDGACTDAEVYIILCGGESGEESSGEITLDGDFKGRIVNLCKVKSDILLSPLSWILIGHDNSGESPGWFLDRVVVFCHANGKEQTFVCGKWLDTTKGDGCIRRALKEKKELCNNTTWNITTWTSDVKKAGTDANVFIQIYGNKGKSNELALNNDANNFKRGQQGVFQVDFADIGHIYKLRIWHDESGSSPAWHLQKVVLEASIGNISEGHRYTFNCNCWLNRDGDDAKFIRELPATGTGIKRPQRVRRYRVTVVTGDKRSAGTDANVFCCLYGDQGDTGDRPLLTSKKSKNKFERNNESVFWIEAVDLKTIQMLKIGHDDSVTGSSWFLEKVYVQEDEDASTSKVFPCSRWLDSDSEDRKTEVVLYPMLESKPVLQYKIVVKTGDDANAGTDGDVFIKLYGKDGNSDEIGLRYKSENFQTSIKEKFMVETPDIGPITQIRVRFEKKRESESKWYLFYIKVTRYVQNFSRKKNTARAQFNRESSPQSFYIIRKNFILYPTYQGSTGHPYEAETYWFVAKYWFSQSQSVLTLYPKMSPPSSPHSSPRGRKELEYAVNVYTKDKPGSGTNFNVILTLYWQDGDSGERKLEKVNTIDKFTGTRMDGFFLKTVGLSELKKLKICLDSTQVDVSCFLVRVEVTVEEYTWVFPCGKWLSYKQCETIFAVPKATYDLLIELRKPKLRLIVKTGNVDNAGTTANVYVVLFGESGDTGKINLMELESDGDKFKKNQTDVLLVETKELGSLSKIIIGHDNAGSSPGWYLEHVVVYNPYTGLRWEFSCGKWLAKDKDDGRVERELLLVDNTNNKEYKSKILYEITVYTSDIRDAGTDANVFIVLYGEDRMKGEKVFLCPNKDYRKSKFKRNTINRFLLELEDIGDTILKIEIGHDGERPEDAWHLNKVEIRRMLDRSTGCKINVFECGMWLASNKGDGMIARKLYRKNYEVEVVEEKIIESVIHHPTTLVPPNPTELIDYKERKNRNPCAIINVYADRTKENKRRISIEHPKIKKGETVAYLSSDDVPIRNVKVQLRNRNSRIITNYQSEESLSESGSTAHTQLFGRSLL